MTLQVRILPSRRREDLLRRYATEEPVASIARDLGIEVEAVRNFAWRNNVRRPSPESVVARREQVRALFAQGLTLPQIATAAGVSRQAVYSLMLKHATPSDRQARSAARGHAAELA